MNEVIFIYVHKNAPSYSDMNVIRYLADFLGMYAGKTSSKHSEVLAKHVSYSSIDKPMTCDDWVTRILNKQKIYSIWMSRIGDKQV